MIVGMKNLLPDLVGAPRVLCGFNVFGREDALAELSKRLDNGKE